MRVTSEMITSQVVFNGQRSLARLFNLQSQLSSGRQLQKPSDDPGGTLRDLNYRHELAKNEQYLKNISRGKNWAQNYDTILADVKDLIQQAKELTITMSDDSVSSESRIGSYTVAQSLFEQIGQLGNGRLSGMYVFSGYQTNTAALDLSADGVVYRGDQGGIDFLIESGAKTRTNLNGDDIFLHQINTLGAESDLELAVNNATLLANLNSGNGVDLLSGGTFEIRDENLGVAVTVDVSAASSLGDVISAINSQLPPTISNFTIGLSEAGNSLSIDIDESAPRLINDSTAITDLNEGRGIDLSYGRLRLSDGGSIDVTVDLNSPVAPTTLGELRTAFNNQIAAYGPPLDNVLLQINGSGTALEIIDANGTPLGLSIQDADAESTLGSDLGLTGSIGASLIGSDLKPTYHFTISDLGGTTAADLGLVGQFEHDGSGEDIDPIMTAATLATTNLSDLNNGSGFTMGELVLWLGETREVIDTTSATTVQDLLDLFNNSYLDITAALNVDGTGIQITNNDPTRSFSIEDTEDSRLAKDLGIYGSSDMMGSLAMLTKALKADDREGVSLLMSNFDAAIDHLLDRRSTVGSNMSRLETTEFRLQDLGLNFTKLLSEVEDAEVTDLITQMSTQQANYQASLLAASQIIQPSLVDFLT